MTDLIIPPTCLRIAQLSDFHLSGRIGDAPSYHRFLKVLDLAKAHQPDLWLLTGDLVNDGNSEAYDWLFAQFSDFGAPYFAIAGNHDVTHEIGNLDESDTNHIILYNTARAKNPAAENGKFFAEAPDIPDEKIAQYAILFEHPDQITSSEEHPGWYWLSHR